MIDIPPRAELEFASLLDHTMSRVIDRSICPRLLKFFRQGGSQTIPFLLRMSSNGFYRHPSSMEMVRPSRMSLRPPRVERDGPMAAKSYCREGVYKSISCSDLQSIEHDRFPGTMKMGCPASDYRNDRHERYIPTHFRKTNCKTQGLICCSLDMFVLVRGYSAHQNRPPVCASDGENKEAPTQSMTTCDANANLRAIGARTCSVTQKG